jgi:acetyl/propionyl-CoA carboxylase alpha subunit
MKSLAKKAVLIANRGEIAIRIARTCRAKGFQTVGIYSDADTHSEYLRYFDQTYRVGEANPKDSYLSIEKIIEVAKVSGA